MTHSETASETATGGAFGSPAARKAVVGSFFGTALGYRLGAVFGGGLAPLIATSLQASVGGATWPVCLHVIALAVIAVICLSALGETNKDRGPVRVAAAA